MISRRERGLYVLSCDYCNDEADEPFESFGEAVEFKTERDNGWRAVKGEDGEWSDLCPACNQPGIVKKLRREA